MKRIIFVFLFLAIPFIIFSQTIGKEAPGFNGKTLEGDSISLLDFRGKITLVDVWASWCNPCKAEFPFLLELYEGYSAKGFTILAVSIDEEKENAKKFLNGLKKEVHFKVMHDPDGKVADQYKIDAIPTTYILDKNGVIRYSHLGFMESEKDKYKKEIETLINE